MSTKRKHLYLSGNTPSRVKNNMRWGKSPVREFMNSMDAASGVGDSFALDASTISTVSLENPPSPVRSITKMSFPMVSRLQKRRGTKLSSLQLSTFTQQDAPTGTISSKLESFLDSHDFSEESLLSYISDHFIQSDQEYEVLSLILQGYKSCMGNMQTFIDEGKTQIAEFQKDQRSRLFNGVTLAGTNQSAVDVARRQSSHNAWVEDQEITDGSDSSLPLISSPSAHPHGRQRHRTNTAASSSTILDINLPSTDRDFFLPSLPLDTSTLSTCSMDSDLRQLSKSFSLYEKELETRNEILRRALQKQINRVDSLHIQYLAVSSALDDSSAKPNPYSEFIHDMLRQITNEVNEKSTARTKLFHLENTSHYYRKLNTLAQENIKKVESVADTLMPAEPYDLEWKRLKQLQKELKIQKRLHEALRNMNRIAKHRINTMSDVHIDILNIDREMEAFSATVTPRPNWDEFENYLDLTTKQSSHEYSLRLVRRYQDLKVLHQRNAQQITLNTTKLEFLDLKGGEFIEGLGTDKSVPVHLRFEGKLRRISFDKKEVEEILDDFWNMRNENDIFHNISFEGALLEYVEYIMPTATKRALMEFMYSFLDACRQYRDDPDPDLFLRILDKEVCELAYQDQFDVITKLKQVFTKLDDKGKISKAKLLAALRKFFSSKPPESFTVLNRTLEHLPSTLNWTKLFVESKLKSQSEFLETVRSQHIVEIIQYTQEICGALVSRGLYEHVLHKYGKNRALHFLGHPKQYQNIPINKLSLTVLQITETCFAVDPLQSEVMLHKWIHDSTGMPYPLNRAHSFNLATFLSNLRSKVLPKRRCRERDVRAELNRRSHQIMGYDVLCKVVFEVRELLKVEVEETEEAPEEISDVESGSVQQSPSSPKPKTKEPQLELPTAG